MAGRPTMRTGEVERAHPAFRLPPAHPSISRMPAMPPASLPLVPEVYVSMVAGVCATCRHWNTPDGKIGRCERIGDEMETAWTDGDVLYTESDFGCVLWTAKGK